MTTKLSRDEMLELMAYVDGQLDDADKARIEALIASKPEARRLVEDLGILGAAVEHAYVPPSETLSAGIAALLAKKMSLADAARAAKDYVTAAIAASGRLDIGHGHGPVHHLHAWW